MSFLAANLAALEMRHPEVAARLKTWPPAAARGQWSLAKSGVPTVRRHGVLLASSYDPQVEASRLVPAVDALVDLAVVPGLGLGYHVEALVARYPDLPVVLAEADPGWFLEVLEHRDLTSLWASPNLTLVLGPDPAGLGRCLDRWVCLNVETVPWRPAAAQESAWTEAVEGEIRSAQGRAGVNLATYRRFGSLWKRNLRRNEACSDVRPLAALKGWGAGVPAVVAAAGPSLADAFPWMEAHRDGFLLIAVDTAWAALRHRGIEPDVLVILDGQYWNSRHVDPPLPDHTLVVTEWTGPPRAFRLAPGRTYVAATSLSFLRDRERWLWGDLGALATGGSVSTAAWSLALHLGCSEVAFAGLDLGYPRGQTHVAGSQFEEAVHRKSGRLTPAETLGLRLRGPRQSWRPAVDGGSVLSDPAMDLYRYWLSSAVKAAAVRTVNLSRRGSFIEGLMTPGPDYGSWPPVAMRSAAGDVLVRRPGTPPRPPFAQIREVLQNPNFGQAARAIWTAAEGFWGPVVWAAWARRAWGLWESFPSDRSARAVRDLVEVVLSWEAFWDEDSSEKFSRIGDARRE